MAQTADELRAEIDRLRADRDQANADFRAQIRARQAELDVREKQDALAEAIEKRDAIGVSLEGA